MSRQKQPRRGRLLLISYFFPPTAGGGVFRPLAMTKYLQRLGWEVTVLTATTPKHYPVDPELEKQIPKRVETIRVPVVWESSLIRRGLGRIGLDWLPRFLIAPDERIFWVERAERKALQLVRKGRFDVLYTTGPPFSVLLGGLWLRRVSNIPWVAEFRDPWTLAPYLSTAGIIHRRLAGEAEAELMEKADAVVMATPSFARMMREKYPAWSQKVHCVENGFDHEDFREISGERKPNELFTVVASGTVFGRYNMNDFLSALERLKLREPETYSQLAVSFQGLPDYRLNQRLLENGLTDRCRSRGFVSHSENIRDICSADLLILPLSPVPNGEGHIPSRAYEFLASGTPILAICPDGDLADLLSGFPQVIRTRPGEIDVIVDSLKNTVRKWRDGSLQRGPSLETLLHLSRESRAALIDSILRQLLEKNAGGRG